MEIDMSIANDILKILKDKCIFSENEAINARQLFDYCKRATSVEDVAKNLSALFLQGKILRLKPLVGSFEYWLLQADTEKSLEKTTKVLAVKAVEEKFFKDNSDPALATVNRPSICVEYKLQTSADDLAKADSINEKLGDDFADKYNTKSFITFAKAPVLEVQEKLASDAGHFKAAITTDGTLILYGLTQQSLELSVEQTKILVKFCSVIAL